MRKHNRVLFSKYTRYGYAQKYLTIYGVIRWIAAITKLFTAVFTFLIFFGKNLDIKWYYLSLGVMFFEIVADLICSVILKRLSIKQSSTVKRDKEVYEAFADMYSRSVFIERTRLFTGIFLVIVAIVVIYCTFTYQSFADIGSFFGVFCGVSVLLCIVVDEVFVLRQWFLNSDFNRINGDKINLIYWQLCLDNPTNLNKNHCFSSIKTETELKNKLLYSQRFGKLNRARRIGKYIYYCPNCGTESQLEFKGNVVTCTECGTQWGIRADGGLVALNGKSTVKTIEDWFETQKTVMNDKVSDKEFEYSCNAKGVLFVFLEGKRWIKLGGGSLYQYNDSFVFLWDDNGMRRYLNVEVGGFLPFSFTKGMYLSDGLLSYRFKTRDKAKYVEINNSIAAMIGSNVK